MQRRVADDVGEHDRGEAALRLGASLRDVDAWLDEELAPFFAREPSRRFAYPGLAEIALAT